MISLQQDPQGFIRMKRHFPNGIHVQITFTDGTQEILSGRQLNEAYDQALADYRAGNHLDAKGFSRGPQKKVHLGIEYVPVKPGMGA
ncbi:hypothetical protein [Paenarthrobacter nitroguajacolicus]|uniref:hypothetical protein n=1 Tax=Paenarthrobacter nitroguajacolicus TaxID=211146 RepID=UPI00286A037E|nr:hypothetical protein [Paenarthrobacter nitroguajacolicus]